MSLERGKSKEALRGKYIGFQEKDDSKGKTRTRRKRVSALQRKRRRKRRKKREIRKKDI
jgi:hypothetical protein